MEDIKGNKLLFKGAWKIVYIPFSTNNSFRDKDKVKFKKYCKKKIKYKNKDRSDIIYEIYKQRNYKAIFYYLFYLD